jgi:signal transduction histidine kinase
MLESVLGPVRPLAESIVETVREPLLVLDGDLVVRLANRSFYRTFQVPPDETINHLLYNLGGGQWDIPRLRLLLEEILPQNSHFDDFEVEHDFPTVGPKVMLLNARRLIGQDQRAKMILVAIEDITERKALEQLQRDFIALVTHELRTPLTVINAYAQQMQHREAYNESSLTTIVAKAEQLNRIIGDLLDSSRLEADQLQLQPTLVDLVEVARACTEQAQVASPSHRLRLESAEPSLQGSWDRGRLAQVFSNLLGNAIKYSPDGGEILLTIEDLGSAARVSVRDPGVGIPPVALPRLFDRFYRVPATAGQVQGLGLGLHVTKALVEAHGGSIEVESVLGQGSVFSVTIPYAEQRDSSEPQ